MMTKRFQLSVTLMLIALCVSAVPPISYFGVKGNVTCNGRGIEGVAVTDGVSVVLSDNKGGYSFTTTSKQNLVYYSLPSGYQSPREGTVPLFYKPIPKGEEAVELNFELQEGGNDDRHVFVVWADPQVLETEEFKLLEEVKDDLQQTIRSYDGKVPFHGISAGDNVFDRLDFFDQYKQTIRSLQIPFYTVIGNHDMNYDVRSDEHSIGSYEKAFGPSYYSFNKGKIHYVVMNDIFYYGLPYQYIGYINETQLHWLEQDLSSLKAGSTVVLSVHIPTYYGDSEHFSPINALRSYVVNNKSLYDILKPFDVHIMAGHSHLQWNTVVSGNILEHVHAAASGAWWQGEVGLDGTPKGYTVYEADGDRLTWYFKGLNKRRDEQFKFYPLGSDPDHKDYIVANVYNYDPQWKVDWYEDGVRKGEMTQYWGKDPLARKLYPKGGNKKHSWLSVGTTNHLFKAKPKNPKAVIKVEVVDRFGNVYR